VTTLSDASRHKFVVLAQRHADMTLEEADDMADFVVGLGARVLETLLPVLTSYKERVKDTARDEVVREIIEDFSVNNGIMWTRNSVLSRIRSHLKSGK
jgi:hypothetical protein